MHYQIKNYIMKKLFLGALLLLSTLGFSQTTKPKNDAYSQYMKIYNHQYGLDKNFFGSIGISNYNLHSKSSDMGFGISLTLWNVYFEFNSNFASGKGDNLNFQSSQSYNTGKLTASTLNIGYAIKADKERIVLTPFIGMGFTSEIWEDPIGMTTQFTKNEKTEFNMGCIAQYRATKSIYPYIGYGTFDGIKAGISFNFMEL